MTPKDYLMEAILKWLDLEEVVSDVAREEAAEFVSKNEHDLAYVAKEKVRGRLHGVFSEYVDEVMDDLVEDML